MEKNFSGILGLKFEPEKRGEKEGLNFIIDNIW